MERFEYIKWLTENKITKASQTIDEQSTSGATDCVKQDFKWNATCSQQHLHSAPGNKRMWKRRLKKQRNKFFGNAGCFQFGAIMNWTEKQILMGVDKMGNPLTPGQIAMKTAFGDWASCMMNQCRVPGATINGCD